MRLLNAGEPHQGRGFAAGHLRRHDPTLLHGAIGREDGRAVCLGHRRRQVPNEDVVRGSRRLRRTPLLLRLLGLLRSPPASLPGAAAARRIRKATDDRILEASGEVAVQVVADPLCLLNAAEAYESAGLLPWIL